MKRFLNGLGVFGSIILTIILSVLVFVYVVVLNLKFIASENGIKNTFKKIDVVEVLKSTENGTMWEDFKQLGEKLNLNEEQLEKILNNKEIKEQVGTYIEEVLNAAFNENEAKLTKEKVDNFLNVAIREYNKVSDTKISDDEKDKILSSFDEEMIANINEEFSSINLKDSVSSEYVIYIEILDNVLFGSYTLIMLLIIIGIIGLIALFRFSYYKWMSYARVSTIISGVLMLAIGIILLVIPLQDLEMLMPIKNVLATNIFITSAILFVIVVVLSIAKKYLKKHSDNKKEVIEDANVSEKEEIEETKENKEKKKKVDKKTIIIILLVLIILLIILFLIFGRNASYTITFDTDGGSEIASIEVKDNEIVSLPSAPIKDGYKFVGWKNEDGKIVTKGTKVDKDLNLKAEWISNDAKIVKAEFDTDGGNEIDNITIEKGKVVLLPINPIKEGYKFAGWFDTKGNFVTEGTVITKDIKLKAKWISNDTKTSTVKFDTDGGNKIDNIIIENGKIILLPTNPTKEGYVFAGWVDLDGNEITKDTIIDENITIKATWKQPYTCPDNCTPTGDGSKCTKTTTTDIVTYKGCPTGTETIEKFCTSHKRQVAIGFDEDMTYETAGILCDGNPTGFCVDYNGRYTIAGDSCPSGYYKYTDSDGLGALFGCTKKYDKGGSGCPSGYKKDGNKCIKTETLKCKAN